MSSDQLRPCLIYVCKATIKTALKCFSGLLSSLEKVKVNDFLIFLRVTRELRRGFSGIDKKNASSLHQERARES